MYRKKRAVPQSQGWIVGVLCFIVLGLFVMIGTPRVSTPLPGALDEADDITQALRRRAQYQELLQPTNATAKLHPFFASAAYCP